MGTVLKSGGGGGGTSGLLSFCDGPLSYYFYKCMLRIMIKVRGSQEMDIIMGIPKFPLIVRALCGWLSKLQTYSVAANSAKNSSTKAKFHRYVALVACCWKPRAAIVCVFKQPLPSLMASHWIFWELDDLCCFQCNF